MSFRPVNANVRAAGPSGTRVARVRGLGRLMWGCLLLLGWLGNGVLFAADDDDLRIGIGVENAYKIGCWTSVRVEAPALEAGEYLVRARVLDADGNQVDFELEKLTHQDGGTLETEIPVRVGRIHSDLMVTLLRRESSESATPDGRWRMHRQRRLAPSLLQELTQSQPWIVAVGNVQGIELTTDFVRDLHVSTIASLEDLSRDPLLWQGIDVLFLSARDYPEELLSSLKQWVQSGGALVVFPNQPADEFLQLSLIKELPARFEGTAHTRDLSRLVSFVGEPSPLRTAGLTIPRITQAPGKTLVGGLSGPVVTLSPWGFGHVTTVAVNLNERVFQNWEALPQLYRILANLPVAKGDDTASISGQLSQNGLTDLKTQWDAALSDFGVQAPTVWIPLGSLLLAAFLVGPLDYFLVRHVFKKPLLTWISLPVLILLAASWGLLESPASQSSRRFAQADVSASSGVVANQCQVIDYAAATNTGRYQGFLTLLAPETGRYQLETAISLPSPIAQQQDVFGPGAVPEISFRGYYRASATHLDQTQYTILPREAIARDVPIYENSTALLELRGTFSPLKNPSGAGVISGQLQSTATNQLRGDLTHRLEAPLTDWMLVFGKLLFFVSSDHPAASWSPGEALQFPDSSINQKELSAYLMGTTTQMVKRTTGVGEDLLVKRQPYNIFSREFDYILYRLTFHRLLGGAEYTSLSNLELNTWDLSHLLELNQAVLIGRLPAPPVDTHVDGGTPIINKHERFVRIVIPVEQRQHILERLPEYKREGDSGGG
ncbi:MAG: hypothetical protein KDA76_07285 [Planctomycetaceae bacterium]|nr:hypothetical protein [Planctomycetaceae bacterium]